MNKNKIVISSAELMVYIRESVQCILNGEQICSEIESKVKSGNLSSVQVDKLKSDLNRLYGSVLIQLAAASPIPIDKIMTFERDVLIGNKSNYSLNCGKEILEEIGLVMSSFPIPNIVADGLALLLRLQACADGFFITTEEPRLLCFPNYETKANGGDLHFIGPSELFIENAIAIQIDKPSLKGCGEEGSYFEAIQSTVKNLGAPW
jgi:hypothetical protein